MVDVDTNLNRVFGDDSAATQEKPFEFWIGSEGNHSVEGGGLLPEDFFLVRIQTGQDLRKAGQCGYKLKLDVKGRSLTVYQAFGAAPGWHILEDGKFSNELDLADLAGRLTAAEQESGNITLLVGGATPGTFVLTARLQKGTLVSHESLPIHVQFQDVLQMYERQLGQGYYPGQQVERFPLEPLNFANGSHRLQEGSPVAPHWGDKDNTIVFVHGFSMEEDDKVNFGTIMFKRLRWAGYKGKFVAYFWPCLIKNQDFLNGADAGYNQSEFIAFKYGSGLRKYLAGLPGSVHLAAHSQGNIVASEALKAGASPATYLMMQAAVPVICYDPKTDIIDLGLESMERDISTFVYDAASQRDRGYQGYFSSISPASKIINMFNVDDKVTGFVWLLNQKIAKPANYPSSTPLQYITRPDRPSGEAHLVESFFLPLQDFSRILEDEHEIMAFATRSISRSVGASNFAGGSVDSSVDLAGLIEGMSGIYDLRDRHSAQFVYPVYMNYPFYKHFLSQCGISCNP